MGRVQKYVRIVATRPVVVVAITLLAAVPTAAALRFHGSAHAVSLSRRSVLSGGPARAMQGSQPAVGKPQARKAVQGDLKKPQVLSKPTELYLRKAHSAVFD